MWANAQRDGCPAEYRWRPLFNAAKFGWRPLLECSAVTLPRRETRWNLQGCPKLANRSQRLVGRSSPYYQNLWRRYWCLTIFFRLSICALVAKIWPENLRDGAEMAIFLRPVFTASRVQHVSDLHSKFALRPHNVSKYGRHPICDGWDKARKNIEEERRKIETTGQKYNGPLLHRAAITSTSLSKSKCSSTRRRGHWVKYVHS